MKLDDLFSCGTLEKADALIRDWGPIELENFVNNEHGVVIGSDPASLKSAYIDSINPKTGTVFARVPCTSPDETYEAILAAKAAFRSWSKTTRAERSAYLGRVGELLREHRELFAVWESIDQGKTLERARVEVDRAIANFSYGYLILIDATWTGADTCRYFSTYIIHQQGAVRMIDGISALTYEHRSPAGVFALISPWNMPLYLLTVRRLTQECGWNIANSCVF